MHMMMLRVDRKSLLCINFLFSKEITWFISSRNTCILTLANWNALESVMTI